MQKIYLLLVLLFLSGCDGMPQPPPELQKTIVQPSEQSTRFSIESQGTFNAGYDSHVREILVITDKKTGKEYLTITGCGTTELWSETRSTGKTTTTTTVEE